MIVRRPLGGSDVRSPAYRPLLLAIVVPLAFAVGGNLFVGDVLATWYADLRKPALLVPTPAFYVIGAIYYIGAGIVLYRILVHVRSARARVLLLTALLAVLLLNELWNYAFFGLRSTLAGFLGTLVYLVPLTVLVWHLWRHDRISAIGTTIYSGWVAYDLYWTYALWRLNP